MDYELAKRLKDAGWPQPIGDNLGEPSSLFGLFDKPGGCWLYGPDDSNGAPERAYAPSTDELIEALGNQLHATFHGAGLPVRVYRTADSPSIGGETLQIALAELWLTPEVQEAIKENRV
jgi:hypothetical protein